MQKKRFLSCYWLKGFETHERKFQRYSEWITRDSPAYYVLPPSISSPPPRPRWRFHWRSCFGRRYHATKTYKLKAENMTDHALWLHGLMELRHRSQAKKDTYKESDWIDELFIQADVDRSGQVSVNECMKVFGWDRRCMHGELGWNAMT